jgi:arylsulfatase A-like enzyme
VQVHDDRDAIRRRCKNALAGGKRAFRDPHLEPGDATARSSRHRPEDGWGSASGRAILQGGGRRPPPGHRPPREASDDLASSSPGASATTGVRRGDRRRRRGPERHGYDAGDGDTGNENAYQFTDPNPVDIFGMADRAAAFMKASRDAGKPFFIQLSWNALHASENALKATLAKYARLTGGSADEKRTSIAAITEDLDTGVGRVLDSLDQLGLAGTTYVIYTSDNGAGGGGGGRRAGLGGGKGSVREGGVRVPFIVRGPGVAANSWCDVPVVGWDLLPTFCEWAGVSPQKIPRAVEGGSIAGLLAHGGKGAVKRPREEIVFHFPHHQNGQPPHSAIRVGDLKLLKFYEDDGVALYDLATDIGERDDLAAKRPADAKRLRTQLEQYLAAVDAQFPTANPNFDPSQPAEPARSGGGGHGKKPRPGGSMRPGNTKPDDTQPKSRGPRGGKNQE